ncbi:hypothetical protein PITCH_A1770017 [uncultured Desulfobacterium sp.]|uniref:Gingipain domain-containing protein n=1 Tax=uncultured Desulfobacterium sp. TaxID=201089 RepID=A0A445MUX0_9BACT|nr:hypothetical protein PITCH_A1770017 [uncultured Desulfobacterium sp.]
MNKQESTVTVNLFISASEIHMRHTPFGMRITCLDSFFEAAPGEPALPVRHVRVALPEGTHAIGVKARVQRTHNLTDRFTFVRPMFASRIQETSDGYRFSQQYAVPPVREAYEGIYRSTRGQIARLIATEGNGIAPTAIVAVNFINIGEEGNVVLYSEIELTLSYRPMALVKKSDAGRWTYRTRTSVDNAINPQDIEMKDFRFLGSPTVSEDMHAVPHTLRDVDYLIITDNTEWNARTIQPGGTVDTVMNKMMDVFNHLAKHKRQRGYRVHVARIAHIVAGQYGDFKTGARDLQEVLRNFLKDFCPRHGVEWVLLGGDTNIIPIRYAVISGGPWLCDFRNVTDEIPDDDRYFGQVEFRDDYLAMRVRQGKVGDIPPLFDDLPEEPDESRHELTMLRSGTFVHYDENSPIGGTSLCWFHTNYTFTEKAYTPTEWIRVEGPSEIINSEAMWYTRENRMPTDLYYSSLHGSTYNMPALHDWDLLNNGIYGQWTKTENLDGIVYESSVGLGRAPVRNADQAAVFCQKLIDYEMTPERPAEQQRFRNVVYVAEHVDRNYRRVQKYPGDPKYYFLPDLANSRTLIFAEVLGTGVIDAIITYKNEDTYRCIPFDMEAGQGRSGWHYVKSATDFSPSYEEILFNIKIPVVTQFVAVYSDDSGELDPLHFVLDGNELDAAIADTHELAVQVGEDFPLVDQRICLYTDEPDLGWTAGTGVTATVRHLTQKTLTESLQPGPHFVSLNGHGNWTGCCQMNGNFISTFNNGSKVFVVWAVSCSTSEIDQPNAFGKQMVRHPGGAAVAYVGFSRSSIGYPGPKCRLAFFDMLKQTRHLARLHDARLTMWPVDWVHRFDILSCTLYGDPEMPVFRDYRDAMPIYVGNRGTKELHEDRCPWVRYITRRAYFSSVEEGLSCGYDGCGFCLREYHTR